MQITVQTLEAFAKQLFGNCDFRINSEENSVSFGKILYNIDKTHSTSSYLLLTLESELASLSGEGVEEKLDFINAELVFYSANQKLLDFSACESTLLDKLLRRLNSGCLWGKFTLTSEGELLLLVLGRREIVTQQNLVINAAIPDKSSLAQRLTLLCDEFTIYSEYMSLVAGEDGVVNPASVDMLLMAQES